MCCINFLDSDYYNKISQNVFIISGVIRLKSIFDIFNINVYTLWWMKEKQTHRRVKNKGWGGSRERRREISADKKYV